MKLRMPYVFCTQLCTIFAIVLAFAWPGFAPALAQDQQQQQGRQSLQLNSELVHFIKRTEIVHDVVLMAMTDGEVHVRNAKTNEQTVIPLASSIGFMTAAPVTRQHTRALGMLALVDGQRIPGRLSSSEDSSGAHDDVIRWDHPWFSQLGIELDRVEWIALDAAAGAPVAGDADTVTLRNGDRLEGFVASISHTTIAIENDGSVQNIPIASVATIALVNPRTAALPQAQRIWFDEGTILDVADAQLSDDGFLRFTPMLATGMGEQRIILSRVAGMLFDTTAMHPLAQIAVHDVEGPVSRYLVPQPEIARGVAAPLGLAAITFRGPLKARYALPSSATPQRLLAVVELPVTADAWSTLDVVIYDDEREAARVSLSPGQPVATLHALLQGSELTIEVTECPWGPIHNTVIMNGAMLVR